MSERFPSPRPRSEQNPEQPTTVWGRIHAGALNHIDSAIKEKFGFKTVSAETQRLLDAKRPALTQEINNVNIERRDEKDPLEMKENALAQALAKEVEELFEKKSSLH